MSIKNTASWVAYLNQAELPVLAHTLRQVQKITQSQTSSVQELAEVILRDPELTTQVLKVANTVYYNPNIQSISTVSRAIALIGFDTVKTIAMTCMVIDTLFHRKAPKPLLRSMAHALHGAVQARQLLTRNDSQKREEMFIAALLSNIGELAFWSCRTPEASELEYEQQVSEPLVAQKQVLGTTFNDISLSLIDTWHLGPLLKSVVTGNDRDKGPAPSIRLLSQLVRQAEHGWDKPGAEVSRQQLAQSLSADVSQLQAQLQENAEKTGELARACKLDAILPYLPLRENRNKPCELTPQRGNSTLQLQILRDLTLALCDKPSLNGILQIIAEGIHRGVGVHRVGILLLSQREGSFRARITLGPDTEEWKNHFILPQQGQTGLHEALKTGQATHVPANKKADPKLANLKDPWIGRHEALIAPLTLGNRMLGMIYADHGNQVCAISPEQLQSFSHFALQARLGLMHLSETVGLS
ncbi:MAG: HDOD domain-containing protein [Hahellaceae bacterium]|nr:HDOD domain-containing protein [Hahellaceae bacterium]